MVVVFEEILSLCFFELCCFGLFVPPAALDDSYSSLQKTMVVCKWLSLSSSIVLFFCLFMEGVSAVLTVPGSDTLFAANAILTATYSFWCVDLITIATSFDLVGGKMVWVLREYLAEKEAAGRKSNSDKDVRAALTEVLFLRTSLWRHPAF